MGAVRGLALLALSCACGRIGIDPLADATTAIPDAAPVLCEVDGTACDDHNICSVASTCVAGVCTPAETPASCTVARSDAEYATTQGERGWYYGFYNETVDVDLAYNPDTDFETAAQFSGELWRPPSFEEDPSPNFTWAYLAPWGGHPGSYPARRTTIRRWVSDVTGAATAIVHASKADLGGDGVRVLLVVDGTVELTRLLDGNDGDGFTASIPLDLRDGTTLDLMLDPNTTDGVDTTTMTMQIVSR